MFSSIILGQNCTGKIPMQYCPRGTSSHCIKKSCAGENPMQCCPKCSSQNSIRKNFVQCSLLVLLGQNFTAENPIQCCLIDSTQLCIRKTFHSTLAAYAILVLCNVVPEAPSNIAQDKIQAMQAISTEQYLITLFTYVYMFHIYIYQVLHVKKITCQTFSRTLSKKVKHSASHAMLAKAMQSAMQCCRKPCNFPCFPQCVRTKTI